MASTGPKSRRFAHLLVEFWEHPTFGPAVRLSDKENSWKYEVEMAVTPQQAARELRQIADWLEGRRALRRRERG